MDLQAAIYMEERLAKELKEATHKPHINKGHDDIHKDPVYMNTWARLNKSMTQQTKVI